MSYRSHANQEIFVLICPTFHAIQLVGLFQSYFEGDLCEKSIQDNFVLIYELLDEAMDFGLPQITDPTVLKSLIFQKGFRSEFGLEVNHIVVDHKPLTGVSSRSEAQT